MVDSYTIDWENNKLVVTFDDGTTKEYDSSTKDQYAADFPNRLADIVAIGW